MRRLGEQGFTLLEVLVTVTILGIIAAFAVPRFANATTLANTVKVASDLQTLDSAIAIYEIEKGTAPSSLTDLAEYVTDVANLKPPKGKCTLKTGDEVDITAETVYTIKKDHKILDTGLSQTRALCDGHTASEFGRKE